MALGLLTVAVIAMAVMAMAGPALAQSTTNPITVDSGGDTITADEKCTLREAITNANDNKATSATSADCAAGNSTGEDSITFDLGASATITLESALPRITDGAGLSIDGGQMITVSGGDKVGVFHVDNSARLDLKNLTVAKGSEGGSSAAASTTQAR